jgi:hypothetical protein
VRNDKGLVGFYTALPSVFCDTTPPAPAFVRNFYLPGVNERYTLSSTFVAPAWQFTDPEFSVAEYAWSLTDNATGASIFGPVNAGATTLGFAMLPLDHGATYCTRVQARNLAGSWSEFAGAPSCFTVDVTPPLVSVLPPLSPALAAGDGWLARTAVADTLDLRARGAVLDLGFDAAAWAARGNVTLPLGADAPSLSVPYYDPAYAYERGSAAALGAPSVDGAFPYLAALKAAPGWAAQRAWVAGFVVLPITLPRS